MGENRNGAVPHGHETMNGEGETEDGDGYRGRVIQGRERVGDAAPLRGGARGSRQSGAS